MVIAVQSAQHLWESSLQCNNKPIYWNLRDPLRSVVSASAELLTGLLPSHVTHSQAHRRAAQDWLWSVGSHPLSLTSHNGLSFTQLQIDAAHRAYVVQAVRAASVVVNQAVHKLEAIETSALNAGLLRARSDENHGHSLLDLLRNSYNQVVEHINRIQAHVASTQFDEASAMFLPLISAAQQFSELVSAVAIEAHRLECVPSSEAGPSEGQSGLFGNVESSQLIGSLFSRSEQRSLQWNQVSLGALTYLSVCALCLLFFWIGLVRRRPRKVHIN